MSRHMMLLEREEIETMYNEGMLAIDIAEKLGYSESTIYKELRRGDTGEMDRNGRAGYSAKLAQERLYNKKRSIHNKSGAKT